MRAVDMECLERLSKQRTSECLRLAERRSYGVARRGASTQKIECRTSTQRLAREGPTQARRTRETIEACQDSLMSGLILA